MRKSARDRPHRLRKELKMFRFVLAIASCTAASICLGDIQGQPLANICSVLYDTKLRAGQWTVYEDGREGCRSVVRPIIPDQPDGADISYLAEGANGAATRVKLILNVAASSNQDAAKRELIRATKRLSVRALGRSIPHEFDEAIMHGRPIKLGVGSGSATLARTVPSKGNYVLSVVME
jgi:hypothetical protein